MEEDARTLTGNRDATLADYAVVQNRMIRENTYYAGQDLAGRTHYAPLVPWIAREVARVVKSSRAAVQQTRGRRRATATPDPMIEALSDMRRKIPRIADWVNGARPNITAFTVDQAHEASDTWHQEMERERTRDAERAIEKAHKQGGRLAYRFPDGWTVNELYTLAHLQDESDRLHHCVGVSRHYWDGIARGEWKIFSMRDEKGGAMVTLTIRPGGDILYAKGHFDRTPGDWRPNYSGQARNPEAEIQRQKTRDRMRDILPDELLLKESAHLVAYARYLNPNASLSGDLQLAGQKVAEAQRKRKAEAERKAKGQAAGQQQGRVQGQEQGGGNRAWR
jgi:flagellar biosynthesis/type III secretory pathway protein FliH